MMSRTAYKGARIDYYLDDCAAPLPRPSTKAHAPSPHVSMKSMPTKNQYALLDTGSDNSSSDSEDENFMTNGVRVDGHHWADTVVA